MLSKSMLASSIEAVASYGNNVKPITNKAITDIVDLYDHDYTTVEECYDRHDVSKYNFVEHDNAITQIAKELSTILRSCMVKWESEVKPTAIKLFENITKYDDNTDGRILNDYVDALSVNKIHTDPTFERYLNVDNYLVPKLTYSLFNLGKNITEKPRTIDEISKMIVDSKVAVPDNLISYLADLPPSLIQDTYDEVFVKKNSNRYLPVSFTVTDDDYLVSPVYGNNNLDKVYLTIMIAAYLKENPSEDANVSLAEYNDYYETLFNVMTSVGGYWTKNILECLRSKILVPKVRQDAEGRQHISLNSDLLETLPEIASSIELIIGLSRVKGNGIVYTDDFKDEELIKSATRYIERTINRQVEVRKLKEDQIVDIVIGKDATLIGADYTDDIALEISRQPEIYKKVLTWLSYSRYQGTYIEELIRIYIESEEGNPSLNIDELNGIAIGRLAAYIVTH